MSKLFISLDAIRGVQQIIVLNTSLNNRIIDNVRLQQ